MNTYHRMLPTHMHGTCFKSAGVSGFALLRSLPVLKLSLPSPGANSAASVWRCRWQRPRRTCPSQRGAPLLLACSPKPPGKKYCGCRPQGINSHKLDLVWIQTNHKHNIARFTIAWMQSVTKAFVCPAQLQARCRLNMRSLQAADTAVVS